MLSPTVPKARTSGGGQDASPHIPHGKHVAVHSFLSREMQNGSITISMASFTSHMYYAFLACQFSILTAIVEQEEKKEINCSFVSWSLVYHIVTKQITNKLERIQT